MDGDDVNYYALLYHVADDYVARRAQCRDEHLRLAREAHRRGDLVLGGALGDPTDLALLVFRAPERSVAEDFAATQPAAMVRYCPEMDPA